MSKMVRKGWKWLSVIAVGCILFSGAHVGISHAGPVNVAAGKSFTTSGTVSGNPAFITDGDKNTANYVDVTQNTQWVQFDLGSSVSLNQVKIWHYFGDGRTYHDVIVRLSNVSDFSSSVTTVFNNDLNNSIGFGVGSDAEYAETSAGKTINFATTSARYVRLYSNGSTSNGYNHYVEVEIWGTAQPQTMFDDFSYSGSSDSLLGTHQWTVRTGSGGPGPAGVSWLANNITFVTDPANSSNKLMRLKVNTNGTGASTNQAEIFTPEKYFEGTYAARVKFTDSPTVGTDGDEVNQTFFTISTLRYDNDPLYSEMDFEYLPNGGWGITSSAMTNTTWYTYSNNPPKDDFVETDHMGSYAGWHTLVVTAASGVVNYYVDGTLTATASGKYYPRTKMAIDFNHWFLSDGLMSQSGTRTYAEDVDWVYHAKGVAMSTSAVNAAVANYRAQNIKFTDNVTSN
ncbi:discoidin domain-containing protein [Cohnella sp. REN36]|uniref:discoidin domain-containing protein n=1 Tax=Cohnella sp. REN36 TaxID=2887347 RepID=UPI001D14EEB2|nr:discoidin domain-containing protein [Cohnella sp. REN36]MCC3376759.1 discoidin domain-containing protein [Cohnella sp. REN36]